MIPAIHGTKTNTGSPSRFPKTIYATDPEVRVLAERGWTGRLDDYEAFTARCHSAIEKAGSRGIHCMSADEMDELMRRLKEE